MTRKIVVLILIISFHFPASAWGPTGHRVVGEIADHHLSRKARRAITKLLEHESMAMASNWADFIKSDPQYDYTHPWHYVNAPDGLDYEQFSEAIKSMEQPNAYNMLLKLGNDLKDPSQSGQEKIVALKFIIHIVGDMHQPMHAGRAEDLGGNRVQVKWFGKPTNLHRVWDEDLVDFQQLSYTEMAKAYDCASRAQIRRWQSEPVTQWLFESYQISRGLYEEAENDPGFGYRYNFDHAETLHLRLLQGGIRLAGFLNEIFR